MNAKVEKEINTLKQMVQNWYDFYFKCAGGTKYDQVHVEEFNEVCDQQLSPYLQRLAACSYINRDELADLYLFIATKSQDLSLEIAAIKPKEKEDPVVTLLKELDLNDKQKKAVVKYLSCSGDCNNCKLTAAEKMNKGMSSEAVFSESDV